MSKSANITRQPADSSWPEKYREGYHQAPAAAGEKPIKGSSGLANSTDIRDTWGSHSSSGSIQSMKVSSQGGPPVDRLKNGDSLGTTKALGRLSIQSDSKTISAHKRVRAPSMGEEPAAKQHQSGSPRKPSINPRNRAPRSQQQAKPKAIQHSIKKEHTPVNAVQAFAPQLPSEKTTGPLLPHAPKINELDQLRPERDKFLDSGKSPPAAPKSRQPSNKSSRSAKPQPQQRKPLMQSSTNTEYSGMILQPDSSPISEAQLAAEIQGIYDGVVTVELKCIDIDAALARDTKTQLGLEQWQALIALHRTLLYEHHDFLMATQHPSASENLRALATKYSMPARMWKHGIHAFLEVLRHRRPESQDYMLAFVVLAYQMMALLFETVPCFTDTWIECLGDLARYRMAIEDDREMHAVWGGVAARWYTLASDRHPEIGRLYHHLGILERPSMRKLASYCKSLTCSVPFLNARDSMGTFCTPIVQEEHLSKTSVGSAEALLVTFFALVFLSYDASVIQSISTSGLNLLLNQSTVKTKDFGPQLVLASVGALFEFGSAHNMLWQSFSAVINDEQRSARPSEVSLPGSTQSTNTPLVAATTAIPQVYDLYFTCFNTVTRPQHSSQANSDVLASVHVALAWFHSLHSLGQRSHDQSTQNTISSLMVPDRFSWGGLCLFLNGVCQDKPIDEGVFESARQGSFPGSQDPTTFVPLAEDYWMRGLLWVQLYLPKDLLPARADEIESPLSGDARIQRVQWLALSLAIRTTYIRYDVHRKAFWAPVQGPLPNVQPSRVDSIASTASGTEFAPSSRSTTWANQSFAPTSPTSISRSSTTVSTNEDSDGFTMVPRHRKKPAEKSWAKIAAAPPRKTRADNDVCIASADEEVR